ncbi:MAG: hypothetical protein AAFV47_08480 [Pseudomonadota bacterium]
MKRLILGAAALSVIGYFGTKFYINYKTTEAVDQAITLMRPFASVEYASVSSSMTGELSVDKISVGIPGFKDRVELDSVGIKLPTFFDLLKLHNIGPQTLTSSDFPDSIQVFVDGVVVDTGTDYMMKFFREAELEAAEAYGGQLPTREEDPLGHCLNRFGYSSKDLLELGMDRMVVSFSYGVEQLQDELALTLSVLVEDFYSADVDVRVRGGIGELARIGADRAVLTGFEVVAEDLSASERAFARCEALGVDRATAKEGMLTQLIEDLEDIGFIPDDRLIEPLRAGIQAEHQHARVTGNPPQPVSFGKIDLYNPSDMPALLGVDLQTW